MNQTFDKYETSSAYKPPAQDGSDSGNFWKYQTLKHTKGRSGFSFANVPKNSEKYSAKSGRLSLLPSMRGK